MNYSNSDILERLSVPSADNGIEFTDKRRIRQIEKMLRRSSYKRIKKGNLYRLYAKKKINKLSSDLILVSTHVDSLQTKALFGSNLKCYHGILDNAATNAAIITLMLQEELTDNVIIGFTGDEERKAYGARELAQYLTDNGKMVRFVVLDVTSSGWKERLDFTIENNFLKRGISHQWAREILKKANKSGLKWKFISSKVGEDGEYLDDSLTKELLSTDRVGLGSPLYGYASGPNESWEYDRQGLSGLSLCLPCSAKTPEEMHSNRGFEIRKTSYINYMIFLKTILSL